MTAPEIYKLRKAYLSLAIPAILCIFLAKVSLLLGLSGVFLLSFLLIFAAVAESIFVLFKSTQSRKSFPWTSIVVLCTSLIYFLIFSLVIGAICCLLVLCSLIWFYISYFKYISRPRVLSFPGVSGKGQAKSARKPSQAHLSALKQGSLNTLLYVAEAELTVNQMLGKMSNLIHVGLFSKQADAIKSFNLTDRHGQPWHGKDYGSKNMGTAVMSIELNLSAWARRLLQINLIPTQAGSQCLIEIRWHGCTSSAVYNVQGLEHQVARYFIGAIHSALFSAGLVSYSIDAELHAASFSQSKARHEEKRASWPNAQDFSEAVQNPQVNFADPELKVSQLELNLLGLPKIASGMFACVFEMHLDRKHWAIRCFNEDPGDKQERYQQISKFILGDDLPYTVDFHYQDQGVMVNSIFYPIVKMDWINGETLELYIERNLNDRACLQDLQNEFRIMLQMLHESGIAHADLQHGNILVSNGEIYLVDYDAFYVPGLEGKGSNELGHANYQHPARNESHFGPYLDNFSARVIDLSLTALIEEPHLWKEFQGGDECLLFRRRDFIQGRASALFSRLLNHNSKQIQKEAKELLECLKLDPSQIPALHLNIGTTMSIPIEQKENAL